MSEKVVSLQERREQKDPHMTGEARCLTCKHEWVAVSPIGTTWLECPFCMALSGRYINHVERAVTEGGQVEHWTCPCGNDLFYISREYIYCPVCGATQEGF